MGEPMEIKVILLGDIRVGKTSIINQFILNKFENEVPFTITSSYLDKSIFFPDFGKSILFHIWDTSGSEKYRSLLKIFFKESKVVILVYDITNKSSFESIYFWYNMAKELIVDKPIFVVIGNKKDLFIKEVVCEEEGRKFANEIGAIFQLISSKNYDEILSLFNKIGEAIFNSEYEKEMKKKHEIL